MDIRSVTWTGWLWKDAEQRTTGGGHSLTSIPMVMDGRDETPIWVEVAAWGKLGELCVSLKKGQRIVVDGELAGLHVYLPRNSQDGGARATAQVRADRVKFFDPPAERPQQRRGPQGPMAPRDDEAF